MDYCLGNATLISTEELRNQQNATGFQATGNDDRPDSYDERAGCARGILAGAILQIIALCAGGICWCLYSVLR